MLIKPLAAALALTLAASPALAGGWHGNGRGWYDGGRWNDGGHWRYRGWDGYRHRRGGSSLVISIGGYYPAYGYYSYGYPSYGYHGYYGRPHYWGGYRPYYRHHRHRRHWRHHR